MYFQDNALTKCFGLAEDNEATRNSLFRALANQVNLLNEYVEDPEFNADLAFTSMQNFKSHRIQYGWPAELDPNIIIGVPGTDASINDLNVELM